MIDIRRYRRLLLISAGVLGLVVFLVYFLVLHSYYSISIAGGRDAFIGYIDDKGDDKPAPSFFGVYMVPRSSGVITAKTAQQETRHYVSSKLPISINSLTVSLHPQKDVVKIGKAGL